MPTTKLCNKCRQALPLDAFAKHRRFADGLQYYCRDCISDDRRKLRANAKKAIDQRTFEGNRQCCRCDRTMDVSMFYPDPQRKDGLQTHCKDCQIEHTRNWQKHNTEKYNAYQREYQQQFRNLYPEVSLRRRRTQQAKKYQLTYAEYNELLQQVTCSICHEIFGPELRPNLDHCHTSGRIRGVLCSLCNQGLGQFKDDVERLANAIAYLQH